MANVPELRFKKDDGTDYPEWEKKKFEDICVIMRAGGTPFVSEKKYYNGNINFLSISDMTNAQKNIFSTSKKISEKGIKNSSAWLVPANSVLLSMYASYGKTCINRIPLATSQAILAITTNKNFSHEYIYQYLTYYDVIHFWKKYINIGTQPNLSLDIIKKAHIYSPCLEEQQKIANLLSSLDDIINNEEKTVATLQTLKKAMLQKMFPKAGENIPEIRFEGFTDAWEQRKLGDCFSERVESMPDGELISVTINDGIKKFSELGRHDTSNDDKSKYKKVCVGDIAYNSMRMWQGASGYSPYEGIVSPAYTVLSPKSGIVSKCLAYQFKLPQMIHIFQVNSQGITSDNWNLKYPTLSEIKISVSPEVKEQEQIAEYFTRLDNLITLHQRKCETLKKLKKYLMQKMFI